MAAFQPVNNDLAMAQDSVSMNSTSAAPSQIEESTPTTPRPPHGFPDVSEKPSFDEDMTLRTPTRDSFASALSAQQQDAPSPADMERVDSTLSVKDENQSQDAGSPARTADPSSPDAGELDDKVDGDNRPTKKKKGQRFFCTGFLPCNLSFTRSEHLARHIR
jgi:hypothetical protein